MEHRFHNAFVGWIIAQCLLVTNATASNVQFTVKIEELPAAFVPQEALIRTHIVTAATMWSDLVVSKPCKVDVAFGIRDVVENDPHRLGFGKSTGAISFGKDATGRPLFEQGWASLLRTGKHAKDGEPDIRIEFQTAYVLREFWWDPDPSARRAIVPPGKLDALSVTLHELGHAMAFNGWIDPKSGKMGHGLSTYDQNVRWDGKDFYFDGPNAKRVYGRPILLGHTVNNYHHLGDERPGVALDVLLKNDLMTAYHLQWAKRYSISPLDIAILKDCGIQTTR